MHWHPRRSGDSPGDRGAVFAEIAGAVESARWHLSQISYKLSHVQLKPSDVGFPVRFKLETVLSDMHNTVMDLRIMATTSAASGIEAADA